MSKLRSKLSKFFRSDRARKLFAACLLAVVICSSFTISSSAEDTYTLSGTRLISSNPTLALGNLPSVSGLMFVNSGSGYMSCSLQSNGQKFLGIALYDSSVSGPNTFDGVTVYDLQFGWAHQDYRLVNFGTGVSVDEITYNWWINNSSPVDDAAYQSGYLAGLDVGLNSTDKRDQYFQEGYDAGFVDGVHSTSSATLGQSLIGDTLSAPIKALNQFILFTSPSGINVSLGMIFGSMIALTLFLAFLKMFAGG